MGKCFLSYIRDKNFSTEVKRAKKDSKIFVLANMRLVVALGLVGLLSLPLSKIHSVYVQ